MNNLIDGNKTIKLFKKDEDKLNSIGENTEFYSIEYLSFNGILDYVSGEVNSENFNVAINESTHIFISNYIEIQEDPENLIAVIDNKIYEVKYIDNPMELNEQLEIYLKLLGRQ